MKRFGLVGLLLFCGMLTGCVKYKVTLTDGTHFTVLGKPKYDEANAVYRYKTGGKTVAISAGRVAAIEPNADADSWEGPSSGANSGDSYWNKDK